MNSIKNLAQYSLGAVIYLLWIGWIDWLTFIIGALAFFLCYSASYPLNDLMDLKEDRKEGKDWKALARGDLSINSSVSLLFIFLILGMWLAISVSNFFATVLLLMLGLNWLHSSNFARGKEKFFIVVPNMLIIQFLKFSSGWIALAGSLARLPFWFILSLAGFYLLGYLFYKDWIRKISTRKKIFVGLLALIFAASFFYSFFIYSFKLSILGLLIASIAYFFLVSKKKGVQETLKSPYMQVGFAILLVLSFSTLLIPSVAAINKKINKEIESHTNFKENLQKSLQERVSKIQNTTKKLLVLEKLENAIAKWRESLEQNNLNKNLSTNTSQVPS